MVSAVMQTLSHETIALRRWSLTAAGLGAVAWLAAPSSPWGAPPAFASLEHVFVFLPLVLIPLALQLLSSRLLPRRGGPPAYRRAQHLAPVAALGVLASFFVPPGRVAGALVIPWLLFAVTVAVEGLRLVSRPRCVCLSKASLRAAHAFLPIGAVWLLLSRLGTGPSNFAPVTVLAAAVHFHFSGFVAQLLIASTGREMAAAPARRRRLQKTIVIGAIAGIALLAAGNALGLPPVRFAGVASVSASLLGLVWTSSTVALAPRSAASRALLLASAASVAAGMLLAAVHGTGELFGETWIGIPRMAQLHGVVNGLGFSLCGLLAHLTAPRGDA